MQAEQPKRRSPLLFVIIAVVIGLVAGYGIEYAITQPRIQQLDSSVSSLQADLAASSSKADKLSSENAQLQGQISSSEAQVASLNAQLTAKEGQLTKALANAQGNQSAVQTLQAKLSLITGATSKLETDRILLGDLRKDVPLGREQARAFWEDMKTRAAKVDPTLGTDIDKILSTLDNYYTNWINKLGNATTAAEVGQALIDSIGNGALDYQINIGTFQNDALLVISNHVDQVISLTA